ncbi:MAG: hypothetical protein JJ892_12265 [Balneola sp.]|nr:hypothetical protein [Balneola sp.]MBO6652059.1 hypothetical protein [Balneola sp.]MBO6712464.1 hypothetical protein [Balneola sp.]MBO6801043.1 hypothetical protein [Balneola sp.]MBO6870715.1 hypothetical protein [Balneola sp.]
MSNTAKRFFKNNWDEPVFFNLTSEQKLLYKYLWERSDIAGVCLLNYPVISMYVGFEVNNETIDRLVISLDGEAEKIDKQSIWFKEFVRFQQKESGGSLSLTSPPHKSAVNQLNKAGIYSKAYENDTELFANYPKPSTTLIQPLDKGYSNSNGNGSGNSASNGSGNSTSNGSSLFYRARTISDMLDTREYETQHDLTKEVNTLINELGEIHSINDPFNHIEYVISKMQEYYNKGDLTIDALKEKLGLLDKSIK